MATSSAFDSWHDLVRAYPSTGKWPVYFSPDPQRGILHEPDWPFEQALPGIRGLFRLDRADEWSIAEDDYCFECGNTHDRSGELTIESDLDDIEAIAGLPLCDRWRPVRNATLVSVERPSDSLLKLGWPEILNIGWSPAEASVILASWGDRFGAVPLSASDSTLSLVVARPPMTIEDARQVAREHFRFCPYDSQFHGLGGIAPYVRGLVGSHEWRFWWD